MEKMTKDQKFFSGTIPKFRHEFNYPKWPVIPDEKMNVGFQLFKDHGTGKLLEHVRKCVSPDGGNLPMHQRDVREEREPS